MLKMLFFFFHSQILDCHLFLLIKSCKTHIWRDYFKLKVQQHESVICCCSVAQSCPTLCDRMNCSTPGLSVPHHLQECAQVHVHCIGDAIQPSPPLMPSSPSALNLSQHQGLSNESAVHIRRPKYCSFSISTSWNQDCQEKYQ